MNFRNQSWFIIFPLVLNLALANKKYDDEDDDNFKIGNILKITPGTDNGLVDNSSKASGPNAEPDTNTQESTDSFYKTANLAKLKAINKEPRKEKDITEFYDNKPAVPPKDKIPKGILKISPKDNLQKRKNRKKFKILPIIRVTPKTPTKTTVKLTAKNNITRNNNTAITTGNYNTSTLLTKLNPVFEIKPKTNTIVKESKNKVDNSSNHTTVENKPKVVGSLDSATKSIVSNDENKNATKINKILEQTKTVTKAVVTVPKNIGPYSILTLEGYKNQIIEYQGPVEPVTHATGLLSNDTNWDTMLKNISQPMSMSIEYSGTTSSPYEYITPYKSQFNAAYSYPYNQQQIQNNINYSERFWNPYNRQQKFNNLKYTEGSWNAYNGQQIQNNMNTETYRQPYNQNNLKYNEAAWAPYNQQQNLNNLQYSTLWNTYNRQQQNQNKEPYWQSYSQQQNVNNLQYPTSWNTYNQQQQNQNKEPYWQPYNQQQNANNVQYPTSWNTYNRQQQNQNKEPYWQLYNQQQQRNNNMYAEPFWQNNNQQQNNKKDMMRKYYNTKWRYPHNNDGNMAYVTPKQIGSSNTMASSGQTPCTIDYYKTQCYYNT